MIRFIDSLTTDDRYFKKRFPAKSIIINYLSVAATANKRCPVTRDRHRRHGFRMSVMNGEVNLPVTRRKCFYGAVIPGCNVSAIKSRFFFTAISTR